MDKTMLDTFDGEGSIVRSIIIFPFTSVDP